MYFPPQIQIGINTKPCNQHPLLNPLFWVLIILSGNFQISLANSAQPGLWSAGGTSTFSLLFPEDSAHFKKMQMVKELVTIKLYDGFAVIKGSYWMYNSTSETIKIKTGYPINSMFDSEKNHRLTEVHFDELYQLQVFSNGLSTKLLKKPIDHYSDPYTVHNWYVWENEFAAMDTTLVQVYFMVNTQNAILRQGYAKEKMNGFIYLLESGSTWKQPIVNGQIQIQLDEKISFDYIRGISPDSIFKWNATNRLFITSFTNLSPTPENNIVLTYKLLDDHFEFQTAVLKWKKYFKELDEIETLQTDKLVFEQVKMSNPFETKTFVINPFTVIIFGPIILLIVVVVVVILIVKRYRKRAK